MHVQPGFAFGLDEAGQIGEAGIEEVARGRASPSGAMAGSLTITFKCP